MATFDGAFPAPKILPSAFGLFSVATPENPNAEDKWVRGFDQWWETTPNFVRNWDETSTTSYVVDSNPGATRYSHHIPFFIEVEDFASTLGLNGEDRFAKVLRQLEACSQKAVEAELWNGLVALQGTGTDLVNPYLSKGSSVNILAGRTSAGVVADPVVNGAAISVKNGIAVLEYQIGQYSSAGEQGFIHITRDTAAVLSSYNQMVVDYYDPNKGSRQHLQTFGGTPLVLGSGYSGDGPVVNVTNKGLTTNVVTLTTANNHGLAVGDTVVVTGVGSPFDGTFVTTTGTAGKTINYAKTATDVVPVTTTGGTARMQADTRYKWIYASGGVRVYLGKPDVVNDNLAQAYGVTDNKNDMRIKATRAAAVYFDTSIHLGVKVDLTLTN